MILCSDSNFDDHVGHRGDTVSTGLVSVLSCVGHFVTIWVCAGKKTTDHRLESSAVNLLYFRCATTNFMLQCIPYTKQQLRLYFIPISNIEILRTNGQLGRQPYNKHHHHGGAVCQSSGMVMVYSATLPPGTPV